MGTNVVAMAEEDDVEKAIAMSLVDRPDGSPGSRQRKRNTKDWDVDASEARSESFSPDRGLMVKLAVPCLCLVFLWLVMSIRTVSPAHVGISVTFGAVSSATLSPGLHFVNPLASVTELNLKTQLLRTENVVPTQEGLTVELDVSLLYHLEPDKAREIFLTLGDSYEEILILPELQSAVRGLTSEVSAKALYTSGRTEIRNKLMDELAAKLKPRGIFLEDVLLKGIKLPKQLTDAIELKAQAEQASARMEFVLTKEKQEAERKKVEASGISAFQKIVSEGISPALLQWKGIEATENLAMSPNAKIVVMGNTKDSLPVLLSTAGEDSYSSNKSKDKVVPLAPNEFMGTEDNNTQGQGN